MFWNKSRSFFRFKEILIFKKDGTRWLNVGSDYTGNWAAANSLLETFINNDTFVTYTDGEVVPEKTNLSKAVKPKTDN
mgnify:CR=1 FL=1